MDFSTILFFFVSFGVGITACVVFLVLVERRAISVARQKANAKGQIAKQDQAERLIMFLTEVKAAYDKAKAENKDIKAFAAQELPGIALRYPDIMLRFGTRLYKLVSNGDSAGIEGILTNGLLGE